VAALVLALVGLGVYPDFLLSIIRGVARGMMHL